MINFFVSLATHIIYSVDQISETGHFSIFNRRVFYMDSVPSAITFFECCYIALFGVISSSLAALIATKKILNLKPQEILRHE